MQLDAWTEPKAGIDTGPESYRRSRPSTWRFSRVGDEIKLCSDERWTGNQQKPPPPDPHDETILEDNTAQRLLFPGARKDPTIYKSDRGQAHRPSHLQDKTT